MAPLAISIRQPFAELILRGRKRHEFRSTRLSDRMLHRDVFLYAPAALHDEAAAMRMRRVRELPRKCIVGSLQFVACEWDDDEDAYAWRIARVRRIEPPLLPERRAQPGFFRPW